MNYIEEMAQLLQPIVQKEYPLKEWFYKKTIFGTVCGFAKDPGKEEDNSLEICIREHPPYMSVGVCEEERYLPKLVDEIYTCVYDYLNTINYEGFLVFENYCHEHDFVDTKTNTPAVATGESSKKVQALTRKLDDYFTYHPQTWYYAISYSTKRGRKKYPLRLTRKNNRYAIELKISGKNKKIILENEEQIRQLYEHMDVHSKQVKQLVLELAEQIKQYDSLSMYDEQTESLIMMNKRIPFFGQYVLDQGYCVRLFYKTFKGKDLNDLHEILLDYAKEYIKKNRVKAVLTGGTMDTNQQFYLKVFNQHTKNPLKMFKKRLRSRLSTQELLTLIQQEIDQPMTSLSDKEVECFKQNHWIRSTLHSGFRMGNLCVCRGKNLAFVEKIKKGKEEKNDECI